MKISSIVRMKRIDRICLLQRYHDIACMNSPEKRQTFRQPGKCKVYTAHKNPRHLCQVQSEMTEPWRWNQREMKFFKRNYSEQKWRNSSLATVKTNNYTRKASLGEGESNNLFPWINVVSLISATKWNLNTEIKRLLHILQQFGLVICWVMCIDEVWKNVSTTLKWSLSKEISRLNQTGSFKACLNKEFWCKCENLKNTCCI